MIFRAFSTKGNCGKRKKTQINEAVGKTSPVGEVCLVMEVVTVESGWPAAEATLGGGRRGGPDMTAGSSWHVLYLSHRDSTSSPLL